MNAKEPSPSASLANLPANAAGNAADAQSSRVRGRQSPNVQSASTKRLSVQRDSLKFVSCQCLNRTESLVGWHPLLARASPARSGSCCFGPTDPALVLTEYGPSRPTSARTSTVCALRGSWRGGGRSSCHASFNACPGARALILLCDRPPSAPVKSDELSALASGPAKCFRTGVAPRPAALPTA